MTFIENIKEKAKKDVKTIILPESEDLRVLKAAEKVMKEGFANIILIGNESKIKEDSLNNNINLEGIKIIDPNSNGRKLMSQ